MAPTLNPTTDETGARDWVFMRPYMERSLQEQDAGKDNRYGLKRGDVVMFWKPHKPEEIGIKRVVGTAGDTVYPTRGYALDERVRETRVQGSLDGLADYEENVVLASETGKVVVPYGHVWVEGDNWRKSYDSNDFGPISKGLILGKAVWSWRDWFSIKEVGDGRREGDAKMRSRIVEGEGQVPVNFLE